MDDRYERLGTVARAVGGALLSGRVVANDNIRVSMTHFVPDGDLEQFDRIVRFLSSDRKVITPRQFFDHYRSESPEPIDGKSILLTFDDGLLSSFNAAQHVLNPLGLKAIFFVPTAVLDLRTREQMYEFVRARVYFANGDGLRPAEYVTMNVEHLRELHAQGHMILPHTHSHPRARDIASPEDVALELVGPKTFLEDLLQSPVNGFALPVGTPGSVSAYAYREIAAMYSVCFTSLGGVNTCRTDRRFVRRDSIHPWYSVEHVRNIADGLFDPYFAVKTKLLEQRAGRKHLPTTPGARSPSSRGTSSSRASFIARVAGAFERGGVEYVFLHGYGREPATDSDLDVAVGRSSLNVADTIIRGGTFGRLVQCLHHDVPWGRYYVVEVDEPARRYRQLDVVCDPWGIGRDGIAVLLALSSPVSWRGVRIPEPAAEAVYLAIKRARKRRYRSSDQRQLARVYRRDTAGAARLLSQHFGSAGRRLATALERNDPDLTQELEALRKRLIWQRRSPTAIARRMVLVPLRIGSRLYRPTGLAVCVLGRDAKGRASLIHGLERETDGLFRRVRVVDPRHRLRSLAGLAWWPSVMLDRARASLVVLDGGALFPRADVTFLLEEPTGAARLDAGNKVARRDPERLVLLDASASSEAMLGRVLEAIGDCLATRQHEAGRVVRLRPAMTRDANGPAGG